MILVDTSVWIQFFRGKDKNLAGELESLLESDTVILAAPVRIEILSGCSKTNLLQLRRLLSALPLFFPGIATWQRMDVWIEQAVSAGQQFGVGDLLIASIAVDQKSLVWSLDSDFIRMKELGWVNLHNLE